MNKMSFVILFPGRSGGTWLLSILGSSAYTQLHEERLRNSYNVAFERRWGEAAAVAAQELLIRDFLRPNRYVHPTAFGFITRFAHVLDRGSFRRILKQHNARVISLTRENRVKHALSFLSGEDLHRRTGLFHVIPRDSDSGEAMGSFSPDPDVMVRVATRLEREIELQQAFVSNLGLGVLHLTYEQMQANIAQVTNDVYEFLGLPDADQAVVSLLRKNMSDDLREALPNYDAVRERFRGTKFEVYFPD